MPLAVRPRHGATVVLITERGGHHIDLRQVEQDVFIWELSPA